MRCINGLLLIFDSIYNLSSFIFCAGSDCYWHWYGHCGLSLSPIYSNGNPLYTPVFWGSVCLLPFNPKYCL